MGLFDKKICDLCGEKIGLFGGQEVGSAQLCSDCAGKLSPWLDPEGDWDVESLREHLAYREENREMAEEFHITREIGDSMYVYLDEDAGLFAVTDEVDVETADIISLDEVIECNLEVEEEEEEEFDIDEEGEDVSYDPPRFHCSYVFHMNIVLDHPFLEELNFQLNEDPVEVDSEDCLDPDTGEYDPELDEFYMEYLDMADEIMEALTGELPVDEEEESEEAGESEGFCVCPYCNSRVRWTDNGRCPNCGGSLDI